MSSFDLGSIMGGGGGVSSEHRHSSCSSLVCSWQPVTYYKHHSISNNWQHDCLSKCLFRLTSKKTSQLYFTALCEGNLPVVCGFPYKGPVIQEAFPSHVRLQLNHWLLTHWPLGDLHASLKMEFSILFYWLVSSDLLMIMPCDECIGWDLTDDESTLLQVMAWCRKATSHYLSQCWLVALWRH